MSDTRALVVAAALVVALPLAFFTHAGHRLALDSDGALVLTETSYWGLRERRVATIDGRAGWWMITWRDGRTELWDWERETKRLKLSAKVAKVK